MRGKSLKRISKRIFLNTCVCPTFGWLERSGDIDELIGEPSVAEKFRQEQGLEVHKKARELYPKGYLVKDISLEKAAKTTKTLMADPDVSVLFEGTFLHDSFVAKADILVRRRTSWHVIEVKSHVNDSKDFLDDMAYTATIMTCCGIRISAVSLLLVSKEYRLGMAPENLFQEIDHTTDVLGRIETFKSLLGPVNQTTSASQKPDSDIKFACRRCEIFKHCFGRGIKNHIFDIPRLTESKFELLKSASINSIEAIPDDFSLTPNQKRIRNCVITKVPFVSDKLAASLENIQWPAYYLDFETVMTAIPLYPDIAPYTQLPIQFSIHHCSRLGHIISQVDYLADPTRDCRREIAEGLIENLGTTGSIITYSNFEKTIVNNLAREFPDNASALTSLVDRIVDLEVIMRKNFYDPGFHGSMSLKNVLPVLVPELSYEKMAIQDGGTATATFAYMAWGKYTTKETQMIEKNLKAYCKQDTLAMIRLHQKLTEYV